MNIFNRRIILLFLILGLCNCTTTQTRKDVQEITDKSSNKSTVLLFDFSETDENGIPLNNALEIKNYYLEAEECVGPSMLDANHSLRILSAKEFADSMFPYFMPSTRPHTQQEYEKFLERPRVQQKISELNVQYLVVLKKTTKKDIHGDIMCGASPLMRSGGCFGLEWWNRNTKLSAEVWHLSSRSLRGSIKAEAAGTGVMPAFLLPIPIYMPATESAACEQVGTQLGMALAKIQ